MEANLERGGDEVTKVMESHGQIGLAAAKRRGTKPAIVLNLAGYLCGKFHSHGPIPQKMVYKGKSN